MNLDKLALMGRDMRTRCAVYCLLAVFCLLGMVMRGAALQ